MTSHFQSSGDIFYFLFRIRDFYEMYLTTDFYIYIYVHSDAVQFFCMYSLFLHIFHTIESGRRSDEELEWITC